MFLSQVFLLVFLTICTVLFYFSVSCCVTVMAVSVTTLVILLLINLDLDLVLVKLPLINKCQSHQCRLHKIRGA